MAKIVLGMASSHSPQLSTPSELWRLHAERDRANKQLWFRDHIYDYEQLVEVRAHEHLEDQLDERTWNTRYQACEKAIAELGRTLEEVKPDVVVIVGDDQRELFLDDGMPTLAVYWGSQIESIPPDHEKLPPSIRVAAWARGEKREQLPCVPELGRHIVERMMSEGFDVAQMQRQPDGRSVGHAFTFVRTRLMKQNLIPMVPVMINTYYPPNQPTAARCYAFGQALGRAIESWDGGHSGTRVAVIASGGLSHFVIDEELDARILDGLKAGDGARLGALTQSELTSGTSEVRNWIALAGAAQDLKVEVLDYVPTYRSPAGTGCGMAFARWS
jgi:3-O-methylgallate 3,4-dioxygenase